MRRPCGRANSAARRTGEAFLFWLAVLFTAALPGDLPAAPAQAEATPEAMRLERVVLVQRHGVRAPTQSAETLERWAARPWPAWPVGRGMLTPQGAAVVGLVIDGLRAHYAAEGLLPATGCPGEAVVVWADSRVERTLASGQAISEHLAQGCGVAVGHHAEGTPDPLFNSLVGACRIDPEAGRDALLAATAGGMGLVDRASKAAIDRIETILNPESPAAPAPASSFVVEAGGAHFKGPLAVAAAAGEIFLLEYAQGMPVTDVAWGEASDPALIGVLIAARARTSALGRNLPYFADRRGAGMARLMLAALSDLPRAQDPAIGPQARLVALAGHDNNLSDMAGVFDVAWTLPGQPDATAPATVFALERWRDTGSGAVWVKLRIWYAELDAMRRLDPAGVGSVAVALPDCPGGACLLEDLRSRVLGRLDPLCGQ